ncbi:uncharacterized protein LOC118201833, partial [Stegodyphus dumicola]|uniref:uncharacterized protein LOC118201833 n=1 Tax=Stegodyphus dumicola TaxID=202533 RepID=UPI0015A7A649
MYGPAAHAFPARGPGIAAIAMVTRSQRSLFISLSEATQKANMARTLQDLPILVLPTIIAEDYDTKMVLPEDRDMERERIRSLSGGAKASSSGSSRESSSSSITGRFRRQSGDDAHNKKTGTALFDAFRPRSKSDSKSKRPTFMSSLRSSMMSPTGTISRSTVVSPTSPLATHSIPPPQNNLLFEPHRPRSGSDSRGAVSKMFEMLRHRSQSVTSDLKNKSKLGTNSTSNSSSGKAVTP